MPRPRHILLLPLALLAGCSQPPDLPQLGRGTPTVTNRRILSGTLGSKDYREIFNTINRDGKLDGLRGFFKNPTDEELTKVGHAFSHQLYESDDLLRIISARHRARAFSEKLGLAPHRDLLWNILNAKETPGLLASAREVWSEEWAELARKVHDEGNLYPDKSDPLSATLFTTDLKKFLSSPIRPEAEKVWTNLRTHSFGDKLLETLATLREEHGHRAFQGLGAGLASLLPQKENGPNKLQKLLELIHGAHRPTDGLFTAISTKLTKEPEYVNQIGERFRPMIVRAAVGHTRNLISEKKQAFWVGLKSKELTPLFTVFRKAMERVGGKALDHKVEDDALIHNLKIYTSAFALTKWMEKVVDFQMQLWEDTPDPEFGEDFWKTTITLKAFDVDARSAESFEQMKAVGLKDFVKQMEKAKDAQLGIFLYQFPEITELSLEKALELAIETVSAVRPVADPIGFVRALAFPLTQPPEDDTFTFEDFESKESLMVGINLQLSRMYLSSWRKLKSLLFVEMELAQIDDKSSDTRRLILNFYPEVPPGVKNADGCEEIEDFSKDEPIRCRMASMLDRLPALYEFDKEVKGFPSPFTTYHSLLMHSSAKGLPAYTGFFAFLGKAKFATPEYPFFMDLLQKEVPIGRGVGSFSVLGDDRHTFLRPLAQIDPKAFFAILEKATPDIEGMIRAFFEDKLWEQWPSLTSDERKWIEEFLGGQDWKDLWAFFSKHGSRETLKQITAELKQLTANGYLKEAMKLLYHFQNPSLHRIADLWLDWNSSGQWSQFLVRLEELL